MKKIIKFVLFLLLIIPTSTLALSKDYNDYVGKYYNIKNDEKVNIYLFYSKICPHCQKEEKYFETLKEKYQDKINIYTYEVTENKTNNEIMKSLKKELKDQCSEYQKLQAKANEAMSEYNVTPSKEKMMEQTMLWGSIQMNTLLDSSEQHIAEMMINGTTMGIIDMTKKLNELEQPKAKEKEIAEEFIENSQAYIDMWKNYL